MLAGRRCAAVVAIAGLLAAGCSSDSSDGDDTPSTTSGPIATDAADTTTVPASTGTDDTDTDDPDGTGTTDDAEPAAAEPARDAGTVDADPGVEPEGFTTATVRVTAADGSSCEVCLWLADTTDERNRGLMGVTDLGEPVGMLFRFADETDGSFFMFRTPMPLSIAWFGADGDHVGETDMAPCMTDDSSTCERYNPGADYVDAIEMVQGELDVIGIGPGATLEVLDEHDVCPATS